MPPTTAESTRYQTATTGAEVLTMPPTTAESTRYQTATTGAEVLTMPPTTADGPAAGRPQLVRKH